MQEAEEYEEEMEFQSLLIYSEGANGHTFSFKFYQNRDRIGAVL